MKIILNVRFFVTVVYSSVWVQHITVLPTAQTTVFPANTDQLSIMLKPNVFPYRWKFVVLILLWVCYYIFHFNRKSNKLVANARISWRKYKQFCLLVFEILWQKQSHSIAQHSTHSTASTAHQSFKTNILSSRVQIEVRHISVSLEWLLHPSFQQKAKQYSRTYGYNRGFGCFLSNLKIVHKKCMNSQKLLYF